MARSVPKAPEVFLRNCQTSVDCGQSRSNGKRDRTRKGGTRQFFFESGTPPRRRKCGDGFGTGMDMDMGKCGDSMIHFTPCPTISLCPTPPAGGRLFGGLAIFLVAAAKNLVYRSLKQKGTIANAFWVCFIFQNFPKKQIMRHFFSSGTCWGLR